MRTSIRGMLAGLLAVTILVAPSTPANASVTRISTIAAAEAHYTGKSLYWTKNGYFHRATLVRWTRTAYHKQGVRYWPVFRYSNRRICQLNCPRSILSYIWDALTGQGLMPGLSRYTFVNLLGDTYTHVVKPCFSGMAAGFAGGVLVSRGLPILAEDGALTGASVVEAAGGPYGAIGIVMGACVSTIVTR